MLYKYTAVITVDEDLVRIPIRNREQRLLA